MTEIPVQLRQPEFRFCRLAKIFVDERGKKTICPLEEWSKINYAWNDPILQEHLAQGGNYAVLCGFGGLVVIDLDVDKPDFEKALQALQALPATFTVKTPRGGFHFYFICQNFNGSGFPTSFGDIKAKGNIVNGAGSKVEGGNVYAPNP